MVYLLITDARMLDEHAYRELSSKLFTVEEDALELHSRPFL